MRIPLEGKEWFSLDIIFQESEVNCIPYYSADMFVKQTYSFLQQRGNHIHPWRLGMGSAAIDHQ